MAERPDDVEEQHKPVGVGVGVGVGVSVVPGLVFVGVVEHQGSSLFPVADLAADPDPGRRGRLGDHERQGWRSTPR